MKIAHILSIWTVATLSVLAQDVIHDYDHSVDFSQYKTFDWVENEQIPIVSDNPSLTLQFDLEEEDRKIRAQIEGHLQKKGYQKITDGEPDFLVSYYAVGRTDMQSSQRDSAALPANVPYGHWRPFYTASQDYRLQRKGTLTVDLVDRATSQLMWRGSATQTYSKPEDGPKRAKKAIDKMFKKFPPK
ncbi:MAG: DUF4136 domain-containing protein [Acidobacteria bacterium]|nr:DUF4136 domain-containing protein [Acidobacteriota bacterium]